MAKHRIIRSREVEHLTGLSRRQIERLESLNLFQRRHLVGQRALGWYEYDIDRRAVSISNGFSRRLRRRAVGYLVLIDWPNPYRSLCVVPPACNRGTTRILARAHAPFSYISATRTFSTPVRCTPLSPQRCKNFWKD